MYVAVRGDMTAGAQLAQAVHAAFTFATEHADVTRRWHEDSNYLVIVSVPNEDALLDLAIRTRESGIKWSIIQEPDFADETTAIALEPGATARRLCANFPLAMREVSKAA